MTKILLVEDDESLRELYSIALRVKNFDVDTAVDGEDALDKLNHLNPYVIILDVVMPGIDGIEVLKILKADLSLRRIPVLMLTGSTEPDIIKECFESGAKAFIIKGNYISTGEIVQKVNLILSLPK